MRWAHLCPLGERALLLTVCLQPSLEGGTAVLAWESPSDTRLVRNGSPTALALLGFKGDLVEDVQTLPQRPSLPAAPAPGILI